MPERCETGETPQGKANTTDKFNSIAQHNQRHCLFENAATTNQATFSAIFNSLLGRNPDDPDNTQKGIAAVAESNLTAERLSFEYRIDSVEVDPSVGEQPMLVVGSHSTVTANELLSKPKKPEERLLHEEIQDWAREQFADGWVPSNTLYEQGGEQGYSEDQIRRALHKIRAKRQKKGFKNSKWGWRLLKKM